MISIEAVFSECFSITVDEVHDDIQYQDIEAWDSLNHLEFALRLEEVFGIELDMDDIIDMSSVGKIKEILQKYGV